MAVFICSQCGYEKDTRCKPKKCPECQGENTFSKKE
jgi:rubrerythrin